MRTLHGAGRRGTELAHQIPQGPAGHAARWCGDGSGPEGPEFKARDGQGNLRPEFKANGGSNKLLPCLRTVRGPRGQPRPRLRVWVGPRPGSTGL